MPFTERKMRHHLQNVPPVKQRPTRALQLLKFIFRRSRRHWLLLATQIFGVLLATAFLASGPVLIDALLEFGLRRVMVNASLHSDVLTFSVRESADPDQYAAIAARLDAFLTETLPQVSGGLTPSGNVGFLYPWQDGEIVLDQRLTLGFYGTDLTEFGEGD